MVKRNLITIGNDLITCQVILMLIFVRSQKIRFNWELRARINRFLFYFFDQPLSWRQRIMRILPVAALLMTAA